MGIIFISFIASFPKFIHSYTLASFVESFREGILLSEKLETTLRPASKKTKRIIASG
jgi:hypothetical protein